MNFNLVALCTILFAVLCVQLANGQCTTCSGAIYRQIWSLPGQPTGPAYPCWITAPGTSLPKCYLCTVAGATQTKYLLGPYANTDNWCINYTCTFPTTSWSSAYTPYPIYYNDPASCVNADAAAWTWPTNIQCVCGDHRRVENTKPIKRQDNDDDDLLNDNDPCPVSTLDDLTVGCSDVSHSLNCPAFGPLPALNNAGGGNCALCDALGGYKCFTDSVQYNQPNHTCDLISTYGVGSNGVTAQGLEYPCLRCHRMMLNNGTEICGAHVTQNNYCYCSDMFDLATCTSRRDDFFASRALNQPGNLPARPLLKQRQTGYSGKVCGTWNHADSLTAACLIHDNNLGYARQALPSECDAAHPAVECAAHVCTGDACGN